jgi:hypothetical protein
MIEQTVFEAYEKFVGDLLVDCGNSKNAGRFPILTKASIGKFDFDFKPSFLTGMILT